jgi:hypothetical protein
MEKEWREGFDSDRSSSERRGTTARWFRWKSDHEEWPGTVSEVRGSSPGGRSGQWEADRGSPEWRKGAAVVLGAWGARGKGKRRGMGRA